MRFSPRFRKRFFRPALLCVSIAVLAFPNIAVGQPPTSGGQPNAATGDAKKDAKKAAPLGNSVAVFSGRIRALQRRPFLKRHRFYLQGMGTYTINDPLMYHLGVGGNVGFHLSERHSISARFFAFRNIASGTRTQLTNELNLFPERTDLRLEAELVYSFSPLDGKFSFFGAGIAYFDLYFNLGAGMIQNFNNAYLPAGLVGVGVRFYLSKWMAMSFEINDSIYMASFPQGSSLLQNISAGLGLTVYVPFSPSYRSKR